MLILVSGGFEGMIQRLEVTATGMNVCGTWDIDREHCSIVWTFLAYRTVIHDGGFMRGWNGGIYSAELSICMLTGYVLLIHDSNCLCFIICDSCVLVVDFVLGLIGYYLELVDWKLHIFEAVVLCSVWAHWWEAGNCPSAINTCVEILVEMKGGIQWYKQVQCIVEGRLRFHVV